LYICLIKNKKMATHTCNQNCGCTNSYTVTAPCPPACSEVFNASCIVYTGTDITCNTDTVIKRYDYLDTVITKLVNYICNTVGPVTVVVGSEYIDVVPATVGNVTTYTVSVDIPALQAYFDTIIGQTLASSVLAGIGIDVAVNPITNAVTISHEDTSAVITPQASTNTGNTFIQSAAFTFDTFGHVTGAAFTPGIVTPPDDYLNVQIFPDSPSYVWGTDNNSTDIQTAQGPADTLNVVAGTGIVLNASTVPGTEAIRITNSAPDQTVVLNEGTGIDVTGTYPNFTIANTAPNVDQNLWLTLEGDTGGPINATTTTDALTIAGANGITTNTTGTTLTITSPVNRDDSSVTAQVIALGTPYNLTHTLGQQFVSLTIIDTALQADITGRFSIIYSGVGTYIIQENDGFTGTVRVLAIG
jgi:hypothetical protein